MTQKRIASPCPLAPHSAPRTASLPCPNSVRSASWLVVVCSVRNPGRKAPCGPVWIAGDLPICSVWNNWARADCDTGVGSVGASERRRLRRRERRERGRVFRAGVSEYKRKNVERSSRRRCTNSNCATPTIFSRTASNSPLRISYYLSTANCSSSQRHPNPPHSNTISSLPVCWVISCKSRTSSPLSARNLWPTVCCHVS